MEVRHLRYFLALAEKRSFTRAAASVHVSQPTLSHQINQLELELGQRLFIRGKRPVDFTEAGRLFCGYAQRALEELDEGLRQIRAPAESFTGELRVGAVNVVMNNFMSRVVVAFAQRFKNVQLKLMELPPAQICAQTASGELDLGLCYDAEPRVGCVLLPLADDLLKFIVAPDHALASRKYIRVSELDGLQFVLPPARTLLRRLLAEALHGVGACPNIAIETNSITVMMHVVQKLGLATVGFDHLASAPEFRILPLEGPRTTMTINAVVRVDRQRHPLVTAFVTLIKSLQLDASGVQGAANR